MARVRYENRRLVAYIGSLPARAERLAARLALLVQEIAARLAPYITGTLRRSIQAMREDMARWRVVVSVVYGLFVEFGTHKMAAQPYFIPAFVQVGQQIGAMAREEFSP